MNVLSIGNSFSRDAQRYLHGIAEADGVKIDSYNLYISGCALSRHFRNIHSGDRAYRLDVNGTETTFAVSLKEALLNCDWDVITLQQASPVSIFYESYQPYLDEIANYVRRLCPKARLVLHQTWAYEEGSERLLMASGYTHRADMFRDLEKAYQKAFDAIRASGLIPSGALFEALAPTGVKLHLDTYHASRGFGRYALGLLWYTYLTGRDVTENGFSYFDAPISAEEMSLAKETVKAVAEKYPALI